MELKRIEDRAAKWQQLADHYFQEYQGSGVSSDLSRYRKYDEYASIARLAANNQPTAQELSCLKVHMSTFVSKAERIMQSWPRDQQDMEDLLNEMIEFWMREYNSEWRRAHR